MPMFACCRATPAQGSSSRLARMPLDRYVLDLGQAGIAVRKLEAENTVARGHLSFTGGVIA